MDDRVFTDPATGRRYVVDREGCSHWVEDATASAESPKPPVRTMSPVSTFGVTCFSLAVLSLMMLSTVSMLNDIAFMIALGAGVFAGADIRASQEKSRDAHWLSRSALILAIVSSLSIFVVQVNN